MKNRFTQYMLIILAIIIWGVIMYKVYNQFSKKGEITNRERTYNQKSKEAVVKDSFKIMANYNNPFVEVIGNELMSAEENDRQMNEEKINDMIEPPRIEWPAIKFFGSVINRKKPDIKLNLVNIANNDYLMKKGDDIKGVKLIMAFKDSVILTYKKEIKTFTKQ